MLCLAGLLVTCLFQVAFSQCLQEPALEQAAGFGAWGRPAFPGPYNALPYGGTGTGDISVAGEMPVAGSTVIVGQVPVVGNVRFGGEVPAGGVIAVSGSCSCGLNGVMIN